MSTAQRLEEELQKYEIQNISIPQAGEQLLASIVPETLVVDQWQIEEESVVPILAFETVISIMTMKLPFQVGTNSPKFLSKMLTIFG